MNSWLCVDVSLWHLQLNHVANSFTVHAHTYKYTEDEPNILATNTDTAPEPQPTSTHTNGLQHTHTSISSIANITMTNVLSSHLNLLPSFCGKLPLLLRYFQFLLKAAFSKLLQINEVPSPGEPSQSQSPMCETASLDNSPQHHRSRFSGNALKTSFLKIVPRLNYLIITCYREPHSNYVV